jgi:Zn-dependent peptidase ImmA (M78 family)
VARSPAAAARLDAVDVAKRIHRELGLQDRVTGGAGLVDVFEVIGELGIPLVFKPLTSALGLCLPAPLRGIMVTTRRGLHIQRYTAAHELGHAMLEHRGSVDFEILERGPLGPTDGRDLQEVAAEAFAAEFLLPRWLYRHHIQSQGWTVNGHLRNPDVVYQLSLRMSASYEATCWGLVSHQILPQGEVDALRKVQVARLKSNLGGKFKPGNSWADVWRLTLKDDGTRLVGNPDDLLRIELEEAAGSGHQWQIEAFQEAGYLVLSDESAFSREPLLYGAATTRTLIVRPPEGGLGAVTLRETQPWDNGGSSEPSFSVNLALEGPEPRRTVPCRPSPAGIAILIVPTVDLRPSMLPVRHQRRRPSCLAFASSTAHEHQVCPGEHLSVEYLYYRAVARTPGQNPGAGTTMSAAAAALAEKGEPVETAWPYSAVQVAPWTLPTITSEFYKTTMRPSTFNFDEVVVALDQSQPVILGLVITDAFYRPDAHGLVADQNPDIERGGHAVVAVGHGAIAASQPALLIRNS